MSWGEMQKGLWSLTHCPLPPKVRIEFLYSLICTIRNVPVQSLCASVCLSVCLPVLRMELGPCTPYTSPMSPTCMHRLIVFSLKKMNTYLIQVGATSSPEIHSLLSHILNMGKRNSWCKIEIFFLIFSS